jgi:Leucine Rich repeat
VLIAILAMTLGAAAAFRRRLAAREAAIRAIDNQRGTYRVKIAGPAWLRTIVLGLGGNERMFYDPRRVSLGPGNVGYDPYRPIQDTDIAELSDKLAVFSNLEHLDLRYNGWLTDKGISSLPHLPKLRRIDLRGTGISDEGVAYLRCRYPGCVMNR